MIGLELIPHIPIGENLENSVDWIKESFAPVLRFFSVSATSLVDFFAQILLFLPSPVMVLLFALFSWAVRSLRMAIGVLLAFTLIISMAQWENSMLTLALVLFATVIAVLIAVPLGILAAKSDRASKILKPILDFMQTMPSLMYLLPAIIFFSLGWAPAVFATIIFALPPGVRLTELGIRQVDSETVEAGHSFGASDWEILTGIQLPLAVPSIMAGINQIIMLSLSMAVIAGLGGADGLGKEVVSSLATLDLAKGLEAGLSVVFLAVFLDRTTAALGAPGDHKTSLLALLRKRREANTKA
ncbi:MAG: glycine/betaine ABC transporter [Actinomycetales bacterium]|nr:MAG: glycine/betaine ABC transporter [Actinomycetales bacterium]